MGDPGLEPAYLFANVVVIGAAVLGILYTFAFRLDEEKTFHGIKVEAFKTRRQHDMRIEQLRRMRSGEEVMLDESDIVSEEEVEAARRDGTFGRFDKSAPPGVEMAEEVESRAAA